MNTKLINWVLRIAVAGEFIGHGVFALQGKQEWLDWFPIFGIVDPSVASTLLTVIGALDIAFGILVLIRPIRSVLLWMAFWGFFTALMRPIAGKPIWDFIERWANWGAPFALLLLKGWPKTLKEWFK